MMSLLKNGLVDPEIALKQAVTEDEAQAARIYRNYVATLSSYQAVDFDDLIRLPVEIFRSNDAVRDKWQRKLRYLLVDEYQGAGAGRGGRGGRRGAGGGGGPGGT